MMRVTLKKPATRRILTQKDDGIVREASGSAPEVDFSIFGAREIRDLLKNKAHCLRAGFSPNHTIIEQFNEIRDHYILRVGLPTYLSQMLGGLGTVRVQCCTLYAEDGHRIEIHLNRNHNQPVQRFIAKQFGRDKLPFKVKVRRESNPGRVEVRYL